MPRPPSNDPRQVVAIRLTGAELEMLTQAAAAVDVPLSVWIRNAAISAASPRRAPPPPPPAPEPAPAPEAPKKGKRNTVIPKTAKGAPGKIGLESFADEVLEVAHKLTLQVEGHDSKGRSTGPRFGPDKVFLHSLWEAWPHKKGTSESEFWERVRVAAAASLNRDWKGARFNLSRADLVDVMNPELVKASTFDLGSARFHFLDLAQPTR